MLSDKGDFVFDPFGGSCVTGEAAEKLKRKWVCVELEQEYLKGGKLRFPVKVLDRKTPTYSLSHPGALWNRIDDEEPLPIDGGKKRPKKQTKEQTNASS